MSKQGILIGCSKKQYNSNIKNLLEKNNYYAAGTCLTGNEILRKATQCDPKVVILTYDVGLKITEILIEDYRCIVILLLSGPQKSYAERKYDNPNLYFIVKPVNRLVLLKTIEISLKVNGHIRKLEEKIRRLRENIDSRIIIEKAKGIIMDKMNVSEQAAYQKIRKQSMNKKMPMKDIANMIIDTMESL